MTYSSCCPSRQQEACTPIIAALSLSSLWFIGPLTRSPGRNFQPIPFNFGMWHTMGTGNSPFEFWPWRSKVKVAMGKTFKCKYLKNCAAQGSEIFTVAGDYLGLNFGQIKSQSKLIPRDWLGILGFLFSLPAISNLTWYFIVAQTVTTTWGLRFMRATCIILG